MGIGKVLSLVLIFVALTIVSVMFIANFGDMRGEFTENTTYSDTGNTTFDLFNLLTNLTVPLGIILSAIIIILIIKWALSNVGGNY